MSAAKPFDRERFETLRLQRALVGLDAAECAEFSALVAAQAGVDLEADELAAAALDLALAPPPSEPLPAELARKLEHSARTYFGAQATPRVPIEREPDAPIRMHPRASARRVEWGWVAAAAALIIAVVGWWPRAAAPTEVRASREALVALADTLRVPWSGTDNAKGADGDVVWNPRTQQGFMRIHGLAKNDPTREQYQMWIFDEAQQQPIDGGVFDIGADGEVLIPIDAKLRVRKPAAFAVTVEKPGGVVVSAKEKVVLLGKVG